MCSRGLNKKQVEEQAETSSSSVEGTENPRQGLGQDILSSSALLERKNKIYKVVDLRFDSIGLLVVHDSYQWGRWVSWSCHQASI